MGKKKQVNDPNTISIWKNDMISSQRNRRRQKATDFLKSAGSLQVRGLQAQPHIALPSWHGSRHARGAAWRGGQVWHAQGICVVFCCLFVCVVCLNKQTNILCVCCVVLFLEKTGHIYIYVYVLCWLCRRPHVKGQTNLALFLGFCGIGLKSKTRDNQNQIKTREHQQGFSPRACFWGVSSCFWSNRADVW